MEGARDPSSRLPDCSSLIMEGSLVPSELSSWFFPWLGRDSSTPLSDQTVLSPCSLRDGTPRGLYVWLNLTIKWENHRSWESPRLFAFYDSSSVLQQTKIWGNTKDKVTKFVVWSHSVMSNSSRAHGLQPTRLLRPWDFPGKSTGVGCHCLLWNV